MTKVIPLFLLLFSACGISDEPRILANEIFEDMRAKGYLTQDAIQNQVVIELEIQERLIPRCVSGQVN